MLGNFLRSIALLWLEREVHSPRTQPERKAGIHQGIGRRAGNRAVKRADLCSSTVPMRWLSSEPDARALHQGCFKRVGVCDRTTVLFRPSLSRTTYNIS